MHHVRLAVVRVFSITHPIQHLGFACKAHQPDHARQQDEIIQIAQHRDEVRDEVQWTECISQGKGRNHAGRPADAGVLTCIEQRQHAPLELFGCMLQPCKKSGMLLFRNRLQTKVRKVIQPFNSCCLSPGALCYDIQGKACDCCSTHSLI